MYFHIDRDNSIEGNLTANSRELESISGELESILTFEEEECDVNDLMERGMLLTKRTLYT